jgi:ribosome-binding protein aMBF1 (putative translation factor)
MLKLRQKAIEMMQSIGFSNAETSISWNKAFPEYVNNHGAVLRGARGKEDITQKQLAEKTGIPQRHISEMENNKRPIGKKNAQIFAKALNIDYRVFL